MHIKKISSYFFNFCLFSNLYIASVAVVMSTYTWYLFSKNWPPYSFSLFIFCATLASYSFHWYFTQPVPQKNGTRSYWLQHHRQVHLFLLVAGTAGCCFLCIAFPHYFTYTWPAMLLTALYSAPKLPHTFFKKWTQYMVDKTILLAGTWTYVTVAIPLFLIQKNHWHLSSILFFVHRFSFIVAICILFDWRDKAYDKNNGVKSFTIALSPAAVKIIFIIILAVCTATAFAHYTDTQPIAYTLSALLPVICLIFLYPHAIKTNSDYLFYFILDGLMMMAPLLYITLMLF